MTDLAELMAQAKRAAAECDLAREKSPIGEALKRADDLAAFALRFDPDDHEDVEALRNLARAVQMRGTLRESGRK